MYRVWYICVLLVKAKATLTQGRPWPPRAEARPRASSRLARTDEFRLFKNEFTVFFRIPHPYGFFRARPRVERGFRIPASGADPQPAASVGCILVNMCPLDCLKWYTLCGGDFSHFANFKLSEVFYYFVWVNLAWDHDGGADLSLVQDETRRMSMRHGMTRRRGRGASDSDPHTCAGPRTLAHPKRTRQSERRSSYSLSTRARRAGRPVVGGPQR